MDRDHVAPPSTVRRTVPPLPLAQTTWLSTTHTPRRLASVPASTSFHLALDISGLGREDDGPETQPTLPASARRRRRFIHQTLGSSVAFGDVREGDS